MPSKLALESRESPAEGDCVPWQDVQFAVRIGKTWLSNTESEDAPPKRGKTAKGRISKRSNLHMRGTMQMLATLSQKPIAVRLPRNVTNVNG